MKQISASYLSGELTDAANWASYIQQQHMSRDEALDYIRTVSNQTVCEAHIVDMDTFDAWSTKITAGSSRSERYHDFAKEDTYNGVQAIDPMWTMVEGGQCVLGKYRIKESERIIISMGVRVTLRQEDDTDKDYLLLRVVPIEQMKEL